MKLILVGGFLGSGKTTAIQQACTLLMEQNKTVAVITNDQGEALVDSKFIESFSIPVKEVINGCFCCNYNHLLQNIYYFSEQINPDIIFAESVGSCTDLVATIAKPLAEMHPGLTVNISVFVDVDLLYSLIKGTSSFIDDSVRYIFKKQMEEADILILNKADLISDDELDKVINVLRHDFELKKIISLSSLHKNDIHDWLLVIEQMNISKRNSLDIDYGIYGAGEAKLAWLDAVLNIQTGKMPAVKTAALLAQSIYEKINLQQLTIGHLKFFIDDGNEQFKISYTTLDQYMKTIVDGISLKASVIINARVQTEPEMLQQIITACVDEVSVKVNCKIKMRSLSAFKPGFPKPTFRFA
jgi:Ni2+-binding GTPase involved in maturation of urease and hydrogenase